MKKLLQIIIYLQFIEVTDFIAKPPGTFENGDRLKIPTLKGYNIR